MLGVLNSRSPLPASARLEVHRTSVEHYPEPTPPGSSFQIKRPLNLVVLHFFSSLRIMKRCAFCFSMPFNVVVLSETIKAGNPLLAINLKHRLRTFALIVCAQPFCAGNATVICHSSLQLTGPEDKHGVENAWGKKFQAEFTPLDHR